MDEHIILVAFQVPADTRQEAAERLLPALQPVIGEEGPAECWWQAEDDRIDGSDNDSAIFVHPGTQEGAARLLHHHGLTGKHNIVAREVRGQFEPPHEREERQGSGVLDQIRADAWDEGQDAQVAVGANRFVRRAVNPYRAHEREE